MCQYGMTADAADIQSVPAPACGIAPACTDSRHAEGPPVMPREGYDTGTCTYSRDEAQMLQVKIMPLPWPEANRQHASAQLVEVCGSADVDVAGVR